MVKGSGCELPEQVTCPPGQNAVIVGICSIDVLAVRARLDIVAFGHLAVNRTGSLSLINAPVGM